MDNERVDRELQVRLLGPLGFDVQEAASGIEALRAVSSFVPDLILLDIGMPLLDGWETARLLRANLMSNAPIIVVSANAFDKGGETPQAFATRIFSSSLSMLSNCWN
ncbi:response regulator [Paraburkholderia tuberum]|uniref:response regulator n=1 Tax=Paraburkholderia tuberum TaxID=157910 RepID=UPI001EF8F8E7|nr:MULTISPECIES: response regulator [Paraburkholderia]